MGQDIRGNKNRAASFNLDDKEERELYQWSFELNFSAFVKEALREEFRRMNGISTTAKSRLGDVR